MEEERRKTSRIKKNLTVQYTSSARSHLGWEMSTIKDISDTGMSFTTSQNLVAQENLIIRLKLPSQPYKWIEINGEVIESKNLSGETWLTRIKFLQLENEDKELIKEYITWFLIKEGGAK
jgi:c-di-GMP-binding flagellar brake protein YcgR